MLMRNLLIALPVGMIWAATLFIAAPAAHADNCDELLAKYLQAGHDPGPDWLAKCKGTETTPVIPTYNPCFETGLNSQGQECDPTPPKGN
jgi:hypothetical protein